MRKLVGALCLRVILSAGEAQHALRGHQVNAMLPCIAPAQDTASRRHLLQHPAPGPAGGLCVWRGVGRGRRGPGHLPLSLGRPRLPAGKRAGPRIREVSRGMSGRLAGWLAGRCWLEFAMLLGCCGMCEWEVASRLQRGLPAFCLALQLRPCSPSIHPIVPHPAAPGLPTWRGHPPGLRWRLCCALASSSPPAPCWPWVSLVFTGLVGIKLGISAGVNGAVVRHEQVRLGRAWAAVSPLPAFGLVDDSSCLRVNLKPHPALVHSPHPHPLHTQAC